MPQMSECPLREENVLAISEFINTLLATNLAVKQRFIANIK
jgi:hypothetical protein